MRLIRILPVVLAAACGVVHERPAQSADSAGSRATLIPSGATPVVATVTATSAAPTSATGGDAPLDTRFADPDTAFRHYLDALLYTATGSTPFAECPDDMGVEHEPILVAAVSLRPIRRTRDQVDAGSYPTPLRQVTWLVESRAVALLDPNSEGPVYRATVAPRTDTLEITFEQWVRPEGESPTNWMSCSAMLAGDEKHDVWGFLKAGQPLDLGNARLTWSPAGSTWATVDELARKAKRANHER